MSIVLDRWALLDPALAARQVNTAFGAEVVDRWAVLDPALAVRKINAAFGAEVLNQWSRLDPTLAYRQINVGLAAQGGGGAPSWVPANAKIHIDLVGGAPQGRAWSNGAEVAIDTLLGSDPNTESGWGRSSYNPANLTADGYAIAEGGDALALVGNPLVRVLNAATIVVRMKQLNTGSFPTPLVVMSADGVDAVELDGGDPVTGSSYNGAFHTTISGVYNVGVGGINCVAATLTVNRFDIAANGSSAVAGSLANDDRPTGNPFVAVAIDPLGNSAVQSITIYDPLPDTTGLSGLSAVA